MAQALSSVNINSSKLIKSGRPAATFRVKAIPQTNADGSLVREPLGDDWIQFLKSTIDRLLQDGTFVIRDGAIRLNQQKGKA